MEFIKTNMKLIELEDEKVLYYGVVYSKKEWAIKRKNKDLKIKKISNDTE